MGRPTASDPLGQEPDPADFGDMINQLVDKRIELRLRGRAFKSLEGVADMHMVQELIARGWAVYRPRENV